MKVKTITCPNCSRANNFLAEECSQCGINFSKYYEELEKSEALRRHIEEQEKAEALLKQQEEEARQAEELKRRQEEEARAEEERRRKEEEARQEAERQKEAQKRADILKRQKEELEKAEEERRRKEEAEKAEALRKQQEEEARQAEELKRRQEEEARAEEERRQREEAEKAEALRIQQEEEARQAEELKRRQEEEARAKEERQRALQQTAGSDPNDAETSGLLQMPVSTPDFRSANTLSIRLAPYAGQMIGIAYGNPSEIQNVKLISVNQDHFQVFYPISKHVVSYPYRQLVQITENPEGISAVGPDISPLFPVVVEVPRPFFHNA